MVVDIKEYFGQEVKVSVTADFHSIHYSYFVFHTNVIDPKCRFEKKHHSIITNMNKVFVVNTSK